MVVLKTKNELVLMREAGRIVAVILAEMKEQIKPGVSTAQLDRLAEKILKARAIFIIAMFLLF